MSVKTNRSQKDEDNIEELFIKSLLIGIIGSIILSFTILALPTLFVAVSTLGFMYVFLKIYENAINNINKNKSTFKNNIKEKYKDGEITDEELDNILDKKIKDDEKSKNKQKQFNKQ